MRGYRTKFSGNGRGGKIRRKLQDLAVSVDLLLQPWRYEYDAFIRKVISVLKDFFSFRTVCSDEKNTFMPKIFGFLSMTQNCCFRFGKVEAGNYDDLYILLDQIFESILKLICRH